VGELSREPWVGEKATADPLMFDGQVSVLTAATALDEAALLRRALGEWRVPTLVLHGTADTYTDPAGSRNFVAGIASADKALRLVDGAFHELRNDACADEVLVLVLGWLHRRASQA
jgi:acylglycerol lipase